MPNKIRNIAVVFIVLHVVVRALLLFSPLMSSIMSFEVLALENASLGSFYKDVFYLRIFASLSDNILLVRGFMFLLSMVFVVLLFDVLKTYFEKDNSYIWGWLFFAVPPAFFSYKSILIGDSTYILWILMLLFLKLLHKTLYREKLEDATLSKKFLSCAAVFVLMYAGFLFKYGRFTYLYEGLKQFFAEAVPAMYGYLHSFRPYLTFDRSLIFLKGLYIYFFVFFLWQAVFKNKNIFKVFKRKFLQTNKTEMFFLLFCLFIFMSVVLRNTESAKVFCSGFLYVGFAGMFCFFMRDVFSESKIFAVILSVIIVCFALVDNVFLLRKSYSNKLYGEAEKVAAKIIDLGVSKVYADKDLWLSVGFYLKGEKIEHRDLGEDIAVVSKISDLDSLVLVHADKGVFSPKKIKQQKRDFLLKEVVLGRYHMFSKKA